MALFRLTKALAEEPKVKELVLKGKGYALFWVDNGTSPSPGC